MAKRHCYICGYYGIVHHVDGYNTPLVCLKCLDKKEITMSWDAVQGQGSEGSRDKSHLSIKSSQTVKIHILLNPGEEPISYWTHYLRNARRSVICPGRDTCPICKQGIIKSTRRHAVNVYDYDSNSVKILEQGQTVMQQLKLIYDQYQGLDGVDITIRRIGEGRETTYTVIPMPLASPFPHTNLERFEIAILKTPNTPEEIQTLLNGAVAEGNVGPTTSSAPTSSTPVPSASSNALLFGKYRGMTLEEVAVKDMNYVKWCAENIQDEKVKQYAQAIVNRIAPIPVDPKPVSNKLTLINQAYDLINKDPRYKGNLNTVIGKMKEATATAQAPNGKMLLQDYTEDELNKLIEVLT